MTVEDTIKESVDVSGGFGQVDGTDDAFIASDRAAFDITGSMTLEAWINPQTLGSGSHAILTKWNNDNSSANRSYWFGIQNGELRLMLGNSGATNFAVYDTTITQTADTWQHVSVSIDTTAQTIAFYENGELAQTFAFSENTSQSTFSGTILSGAADLSVGAQDHGSAGIVNEFTGAIDGVRVWNTSRTAEQIRDTYDQQLNGNETGLVANWQFDDDVNSGLVQDKTSNSNDLVKVGDADTVAPLGKAIKLDGTGDYISIDNPASVATGTGAFTFETWVRTTSATSQTLTVVSSASPYSDFIGVVINANGTVRVSGSSGGSQTNHFTTEAVNDGVWHHVALTYAGGTGGQAKVYINGLEVLSQQLTATVGNAIATIGANVVGTDAVNGEMADVRFWNDLRSAEEIATNYDKRINITEANLVANYTFDGAAAGAGNVPDESATSGSQTATLQGNPTVIDAGPVIYGDDITVESGSSTVGTITALDVVGGTATYSIQTAPTKGTLTIDSTSGEWTYTPTAEQTGADTFSVQAVGGGITKIEPIAVTITTPTVSTSSARNFVELDGLNDYVDLGTIDDLSGAVTLEAWINPDSYTSQKGTGWMRVFDLGQGEVDDQLILTLNGTTGELALYSRTGSTNQGNLVQTSITTTDKITLNAWSHVSAVVDGAGGAKLYINGVEKASAATGFNSVQSVSFDSNFIGRSNSDNNDLFDGSIADVRIWNDARTATEVQTNYTKQLTGSEQGLHTNIVFDDVTAGVARDITGNGHDGTLTQAVATPDHRGRWADFNGTNGYLQTGVESGFEVTASFSAEAWIRPHSNGTILSTGSDPAKGFRWEMTTTNTFIVQAYGGTTYTFASLPLATTDWQHVAFTVNTSGAPTMYVNGSAFAATSTSGSGGFTAVDASATLLVGVAEPNGDGTLEDYYNGEMDSVRFWGRELSADEVRESMASDTPTNSTNLVGDWRFNEPVGETHAADHSASITNLAGTNNELIANNITFRNQDTTVDGNAGPRGGYLRFGGDDYVQIEGTPLTATDNMTVEGWYRWSGTDTGSDMIGAHVGRTGTNNGYAILFDRQDDGLYSVSADVFGIGRLRTNALLSAGDWAHVAITRSGGTWHVYVNGEEQSIVSTTGGASTTTAPVAPTDYVTIGASSNLTAGYLNGDADSVRLWTVARTEAEIRDGMHTDLPGATGLVGDYRFDEGDGQFISNSTLAASIVTNGSTLGVDNGGGTSASDPTRLRAGDEGPIIGPPFEKALDFDGTNDGITGVNFAGTHTDLTIEWWMDLDTLPAFDANGFETIFVTSSNFNASDLHIHLDRNSNNQDGATRFMVTSNGVEYEFSYDVANVLNRWAHVAITVDQGNDTLSLWVDGDKVETITSTSNVSWTVTDGQIGRNGSGRYIDGRLAEMRIWTDVRTDSEIQANVDKSLAAGSDNLVFSLQNADPSVGTVSGATVVDIAPTIATLELSIAEDTQASGTMTGGDVTGTPTYASVNNPSNGTLAIDSSTGVWTYTPNANYQGTDEFTISATGATSGVDTEVVRVDVGLAPAVEHDFAAEFSGNGDHVHVDGADFNLANAWTFEAWVQTTATGEQEIFSKAGDSWGAGGKQIGISSNTLFFNENGGSTISGNTVINDGGWHHVAVSYTAGALSMYVNGTLQTLSTSGAITLGADTAGHDVHIGAQSGNGTNSFDGKINDVRVWDDVRTGTEITNNYDRQLNGDEANLKAYWTFNEGDGTVAHDSSGNNYDGTLIGATTYADLVQIKIGNDENYKGMILGRDPDADGDGLGLSYALKTQGTQGTATVDADGSFTYDHNSGGTDDEIEVTVTDENGDQTTQTLVFDL